jgi:hypothetical protein
MGIGFMEGFLLIPVVLVSLAIPVVTLILVLLIYRKVGLIERRLGGYPLMHAPVSQTSWHRHVSQARTGTFSNFG